jgi:hypothetical protein
LFFTYPSRSVSAAASSYQPLVPSSIPRRSPSPTQPLYLPLEICFSISEYCCKRRCEKERKRKFRVQ